MERIRRMRCTIVRLTEDRWRTWSVVVDYGTRTGEVLMAGLELESARRWAEARGLMLRPTVARY